MEDEIDVSARLFIEIAGEHIHGLELHLARETGLGRFVAHFGVGPRHCVLLWQRAEDRLNRIDHNIKRVHLLWTLNVLKTDDSYAVMKGRWNADEKTIRKWLYIVLDALGTLGMVSWKTPCCP